MTEHRIVARDMRSALKTVRARFGEDALILDSRTLRRPRPGSLRMDEEVEVRVALPGAPGEMGTGPSAPLRLEDEIARLEALLVDMEAQLDAAETPGHPLRAALEALGILPATLQRLARDHADEVPPVDQAAETPALERIAAQLPCVESMALADLRGHHALLGAPGAGRSALATKLCAQAAAAGLRAAHLAVAPTHPGERLRLEAEAELHGHEAVLAPDGEALVDALRFLRDRDLVLIDLPGFAPGQIGLLEQAEARAELGPIASALSGRRLPVITTSWGPSCGTPCCRRTDAPSSRRSSPRGPTTWP